MRIALVRVDSLWDLTKFIATFSLQEEGAKKKFAKRNAERGVSRSAEREEGVAPPPHNLLKKFDQNFPSRGVCEAFCQHKRAIRTDRPLSLSFRFCR